MTDPSAVAINWNPQPPPNRKRWEAEIRSALSSAGAADVEMLEVGGSWRVQSARVGGTTDVRQDVTEYLVAMGFPVLGQT